MVNVVPFPFRLYVYNALMSVNSAPCRCINDGGVCPSNLLTKPGNGANSDTCFAKSPDKSTLKRMHGWGKFNILPGVTIGENAIVAAGAVVSKDVPDNVIACECPQSLLKGYSN